MIKSRPRETDHPHSLYQSKRARAAKRGELEGQEKLGGELHSVDWYRTFEDNDEADENGDLRPEERDY
jgi:hypothetical protein